MDHFNDAFHIRRQGYLDNETWGVVVDALYVFMQDARVEQLWEHLRDRPGRFHPAFREYIDGLYVMATETAPQEPPTPGTPG